MIIWLLKRFSCSYVVPLQVGDDSHSMQNSKPERSNSLRLVQKQFVYQPHESQYLPKTISRSKSCRNLKEDHPLDFDQIQNCSKPKTIAYKPSQNIRFVAAGPNIDYRGIGKHAEYGMFGFNIKNMRYTDYKKITVRPNDQFVSEQKKEVFKHNAISKIILKFNKKMPKTEKLVSKTKCCAYFLGKNSVTKEEFAEALKGQKHVIADVRMIQQSKLDLRIQAAQERPEKKLNNDSRETNKIISETVSIQNTMSMPKMIHQITQQEYYIEDFKVVENYFGIMANIIDKKVHDNLLFKYIYHPHGEPIIKYQFLGPVSEIANYKDIIKNAIIYQPVFDKIPDYKNKKLNVLRFQFLSKPFVQKQLCRRENVYRYFIYNNKVVTYDRFNQLCLYDPPKMITQRQYDDINTKYSPKKIEIDQDINYVINDIAVTPQTFNQAILDINSQYNCKLLYKIIENDPKNECVTKYYVAGTVVSLEGFRYLKHEVELSKIEVTPDDEIQHANLSLLSFCTPQSQKAFLRQVQTDKCKNPNKLREDTLKSRSKTTREQRKIILEIKEKRYRQQTGENNNFEKTLQQAASYFKRQKQNFNNEDQENEIKFNVVEK